MIYIDQLRPAAKSDKWKYTESCHLKADSAEELHVFAASLGLKREWFQGHHPNPIMHHYDLTASKRKLAVQYGARELTESEAVNRVFSNEKLLLCCKQKDGKDCNRPVTILSPGGSGYCSSCGYCPRCGVSAANFEPHPALSDVNVCPCVTAAYIRLIDDCEQTRKLKEQSRQLKEARQVVLW